MLLTDSDIRRIAMAQSARDLNCRPEDLLRDEPVITVGGLAPDAKRYCDQDTAIRMASWARTPSLQRGRRISR